MQHSAWPACGMNTPPVCCCTCPNDSVTSAQQTRQHTPTSQACSPQQPPGCAASQPQGMSGAHSTDRQQRSPGIAGGGAGAQGPLIAEVVGPNGD